MTLLEAALALHEAGLCVLPAAEDGSKQPAVDWKRVPDPAARRRPGPSLVLGGSRHRPRHRLRRRLRRPGDHRAGGARRRRRRARRAGRARARGRPRRPVAAVTLDGWSCARPRAACTCSTGWPTWRCRATRSSPRPPSTSRWPRPAARAAGSSPLPRRARPPLRRGLDHRRRLARPPSRRSPPRSASGSTGCCGPTGRAAGCRSAAVGVQPAPLGLRRRRLTRRRLHRQDVLGRGARAGRLAAGVLPRAGHLLATARQATGISATTGYGEGDWLYVFSSSTEFEPERTYTRFGAYAVLEHGGDHAAAAKALQEAGLRAAAGAAGGRPDAGARRRRQAAPPTDGRGAGAGHPS
jgi:hypothetical protein